MIHAATREKIGNITLRTGYNENIKYGGKIGYGVEVHSHLQTLPNGL
jgi:predicted acetyltransferase